jgi:hypothetical protein
MKTLTVGMVLAVLIALALACGSSSSGSSDSPADDDASPGDVDDDTTLITCAWIYEEMYTVCGLHFIDSNGNEVPKSTVVVDCEKETAPFGLSDACGVCIIEHFGDCDAMEACLAGPRCDRPLPAQRSSASDVFAAGWNATLHYGS